MVAPRRRPRPRRPRRLRHRDHEDRRGPALAGARPRPRHGLRRPPRLLDPSRPRGRLLRGPPRHRAGRPQRGVRPRGHATAARRRDRPLRVCRAGPRVGHDDPVPAPGPGHRGRHRARAGRARRLRPRSAGARAAQGRPRRSRPRGPHRLRRLPRPAGRRAARGPPALRRGRPAGHAAAVRRVVRADPGRPAVDAFGLGLRRRRAPAGDGRRARPADARRAAEGEHPDVRDLRDRDGGRRRPRRREAASARAGRGGPPPGGSAAAAACPASRAATRPCR